MAPVIKAFKNADDSFITKVCVTGQHRELLDQVLKIFEIVPDYDLNVMKAGQDLYDISSSVLLGMRGVLNEFNPDLVFVHGDTTTSSMAALSSFYKQIKVAHVEAGLRTNNVYAPWPEEMNRQITGRIATYHFAPTEIARTNLINENIPENRIYVTGNTVIDALKIIVAKIDQIPKVENEIIKALDNFLPETVINKKPYILITGHRRENFGKGFMNICEAILDLAVRNPEFHFIYPVHLNPNVQGPVNKLLGDQKNIHLLKPLEYLPFVYLMQHAYMVLTDSGGIQEEAPSLGKPVLVMRDTTERPEAVQAGTVRLVGTSKKRIIESVTNLITDQSAYEDMSTAHNPYGDGKASIRILTAVKSMLNS